MNKKLIILLIVIVLLVMVSVTAFANNPDKKKKADGVWCYLPVFDRLKPIMFDPYEGDPGKQFLQVPYVSKWTGTINGSSTDYGLLIGHILDPKAPSAPMAFVDAAWFTDAEVDGKVGDLGMDTIGDRIKPNDPTAGWIGTWVITSGSGELEGLKGNGTFWGPGWTPDADSEECGDWGLIYYKVHKLKFEDDN